MEENTRDRLTKKHFPLTVDPNLFDEEGTLNWRIQEWMIARKMQWTILDPINYSPTGDILPRASNSLDIFFKKESDREEFQRKAKYWNYPPSSLLPVPPKGISSHPLYPGCKMVPKFALVLLIGPSRSGKSSRLANVFGDQALFYDKHRAYHVEKEVSHDCFENLGSKKVLHRFFEDNCEPDAEYRLLKETRKRLESGQRVAIDRPFLKKASRLRTIQAAVGIEVPIIYIVRNRSLEIKRESVANDANNTYIVERHERIFREFEHKILTGDGIAEVIDDRKDSWRTL